jgi:hypothetical protein
MLVIPEPLKAEHEDLARELAKAAAGGGRIAEAAMRVADLLHPRFAREEEFALLPLGALVELAAGRSISQAVEIILVAEELREQLPKLGLEHKAILAALEEFAAASAESGDVRSVALARKLKRYARLKDEVLYPAAVLVGEYLKRGDAFRTTQARWPDSPT